MLRKICLDCPAELKGHGNPERCRGCSARHNYFIKHGQSAPRNGNASKVRGNARRYYDRNRDDLALRRRAIKQQVIDGYGGACVCCGETERAVLPNRRLAESKGSPKIDYENVLCFERLP